MLRVFVRLSFEHERSLYICEPVFAVAALEHRQYAVGHLAGARSDLEYPDFPVSLRRSRDSLRQRVYTAVSVAVRRHPLFEAVQEIESAVMVDHRAALALASEHFAVKIRSVHSQLHVCAAVRQPFRTLCKHRALVRQLRALFHKSQQPMVIRRISVLTHELHEEIHERNVLFDHAAHIQQLPECVDSACIEAVKAPEVIHYAGRREPVGHLVVSRDILEQSHASAAEILLPVLFLRTLEILIDPRRAEASVVFLRHMLEEDHISRVVFHNISALLYILLVKTACYRERTCVCRALRLFRKLLYIAAALERVLRELDSVRLLVVEQLPVYLLSCDPHVAEQRKHAAVEIVRSRRI